MSDFDIHFEAPFELKNSKTGAKWSGDLNALDKVMWESSVPAHKGAKRAMGFAHSGSSIEIRATSGLPLTGSGGLRMANPDRSMAARSFCLMCWCRMARSQGVWIVGCALLFSGGIKAALFAIRKSTKRGQKKGLFAMQTQAHPR
ncbi:hypothetical protein J8I87_20465 [Paraburkholderia sp. LEh10]|uniref:hypothetical protein n=1 Tax=Paraburkholderia sp. LEh10 TaxID=2821353 RepID=UPI001AE41E4F|nr:hypothetical protein [Paraburkholderia sp. LEh10]MBP0592058.1 hypothetical protein [Paraburkholderia sp. LEh10]